jgi:uncharacterized protein HemX
MPPVSAPPGYGYQLAYPQPVVAAPPPPPRRVGRALMVTALVLLLLVSAGAGTFSVMQTNTLNETKQRLSADVVNRDNTISARDQEITQLKNDLQASRDELAKVKQDLTGTQNQAEELKRQKSVISRCLDLSFEFNVNGRGSRAEVEKVCTEANKYLE